MMSRLFFGVKFLFMNQFSIFFVALFTTSAMQKGDNIIFVCRALSVFKNKVICKKVVSKGWCKESSGMYSQFSILRI